MQIHGGDIYQNEVEIDFSANINPFGMPKAVELAAIEGIRKSIHYPDIRCSKLKQAIAKKERVNESYIFCGNGAAEVIFQLIQARRPRKALLLAPTFVEYEQALIAGNCEVTKFFLKKEEGFQVNEAILESLREDIEIFFLCNPNNPTGEVIEPSLLTRMLQHCKKLGILCVIDECFQDFLLEEDQDSRTQELDTNPTLFLLKAFTKMYGMAGLRLGYGLCSDASLLTKMREVTQPWNVSIPAQAAGIAACKEDTFVQESRAYVAVQRDYLQTELRKLGFVVYESKANFIFFEGPIGLYEACLREKILIRSCSNYDGLGDTYYRIAVKTQEENEVLIGRLQEIMEENNG